MNARLGASDINVTLTIDVQLVICNQPVICPSVERPEQFERLAIQDENDWSSRDVEKSPIRREARAVRLFPKEVEAKELFSDEASIDCERLYSLISTIGDIHEAIVRDRYIVWPCELLKRR